MQDVFIKIPKDVIYDTDDYTSYKNLLLTYFYFKRDFNNQITTSMSLICQELHMPFGRSSSPGYQILTYLKQFISEGILSFVPRLQCLSPDQITRSSLFTLNFIPPEPPSSNFVPLTLHEMNTFQAYLLSNEVNIRTDKLFRIYLYIKATIRNNTPLFISGSTIRSLAKVGAQTAQDILDILEDAELIVSTSENNYKIMEKSLDKN